jgi:2-iminobutanoate/2-iminopropanoate deaminase
VPKTRIYSPAVAEAPPGRWSNAIHAGEFLFISGQVSRSRDGSAIEGQDEYQQATIIFAKIRNLVEAAGGTMQDVVKMTIYLVNIRQNKDVWRARQEFFEGDFPASTLVEVSALGSPEVLVEIEAIAHVGAR